MSRRPARRTMFIGLPAYNEAEAIGPLFRRLRDAEEALVSCGFALQMRIVVYNDGSTDATVEQVRRNSGCLDVLIASPPVNGGLGRALEGIFFVFLSEARSGDVLVIMDADDTHDPSQIAQLLELIDKSEVDVGIASRYQRGSKTAGVPLVRQGLSIGFAVLIKTLLPIRGVRDYSCGYRVYTFAAVKAIARDDRVHLGERGFAAMPEILVRLRSQDLRFGEIPLHLSYERRLTQSKMRAWSNSIRLVKCVFQWRLRPPGATRLNPEASLVQDSLIFEELSA